MNSNDATEHAASLELAMQESALQTLAQAAESRPSNTSNAYAGPQKEFKAWCVAKGFAEPSTLTVTGEKLHLFLVEKVVRRETRKKRNGDETGNTISLALVKIYIAGIVDLYQQQVTSRVNSNPHPRNAAVKALLGTLQHEENERRRNNFEDRGTGTHLDGYSNIEQLQNLTKQFLSVKNGGIGLRNCVLFLLCHFGLLRGESARNLELADLHHVTLPNEGYTKCLAMIMVLRQGKTNQFGRIEICGAIRSKKAEVCIFGFLAMHFFWRFMIDKEDFPKTGQPKDWYKIKVAPGQDNREHAITYRTHHAATKKALKAAGLTTKAITHVARGSGARMAEIAGASEAQIRRMGHWNNQAMEGCYLTSLPLGGMRSAAGFTGQGSYFIERAAVDPPTELSSKIWPEIDELIKEQETSRTPNMAAGGFLRLMKELRVVLLQDSVVLQQSFPNLAIWKHEIFQSELYEQFFDQLDAAMAVQVDPRVGRLETAMPELMDHLKQQQTAWNTQFNSLQESIRQNSMCTQRSSRQVIRSIGPLREICKDLSKSIAKHLPQHVHVSSEILQEDSSLSSMDTNDAQDMEENLEMEDFGAMSDAETSQLDGLRTSGKPYKMSRKLKTIQEAWIEWTEGWNGGPAIEFLESERGGSGKWRQGDDTERRFFQYRQKLVNYIRNKAKENHLTEEEAVEKVEQERICIGTKCSLDKFRKDLAKKQLI